MVEWIALIASGFFAGVLNAIAGGGTFLSFPVLVWLGVPPVAANATATLAALPGYVTSSWAFRSDLRSEGTSKLSHILAAAALGGLIGALLLVFTPASIFAGVVPWLLLAATLLFAFGPTLTTALRGRGAGYAGVVGTLSTVILVSIYGGYFNGGLGIVLLAAFSLVGYSNLHAMNGLKSVISALLSVVSTATFILAGLIDWRYALPLAASAALGGYVGAAQSRKIKRTDLLRHFVTFIGAAMTLLFFLK